MTKISEAQWSKIHNFLRRYRGIYVGKEADCRTFIEGVLWITRTGAHWRELPKSYGKWNSIYKRYARWYDKGVWKKMHQHFANDPDMKNIVPGSTAVRAHPNPAGVLKRQQARQVDYGARLW